MATRRRCGESSFARARRCRRDSSDGTTPGRRLHRRPPAGRDRRAPRDCSSCTDSKERFARTTSPGFFGEAAAARVGGRPADLSRMWRRAEPCAAILSLRRNRRSRVRARSRARRDTPSAPIVLAGVSLGGNVLLKYLGERGDQRAVADSWQRPPSRFRSISSEARGSSRAGLLANLRPTFSPHAATEGAGEARAISGSVRRDRSSSARTSIYEFDDAVTAPVHGFADAHDYYSRSSSLGFWIDGSRDRRCC